MLSIRALLTRSLVMFCITSMLYGAFFVSTADAAPKTIRVALGTMGSSGYAKEDADAIAEQIIKASNGRIKVKVSYGDSVAPVPEHLNAVQDGVFQLLYSCDALFAGKIPAAIVTGTVVGTLRNTGDYWAINYDERWNLAGLLDGELAKWNAVNVARWGRPMDGLVSRVPLKSLSDVSGKKFKTGSDLGIGLAAFGGMGVWCAQDEIYTNLSSAILDGAAMGDAATKKGMGLQEVAKYWVSPTMRQGGSVCVIANKKFWEKLDEADRALITNICFRVGMESALKAQYQEDLVLNDLAANHGVTIEHWSDEDMSNLAAVIIADLNKKRDSDPALSKSLDILDNYMNTVGYKK